MAKREEIETAEKFNMLEKFMLNNDLGIGYLHENGFIEKVSFEQYTQDRRHFINGYGQYNQKKLVILY